MDERYPYTLTHSDDRSPTKDSALVLIYRGKIRKSMRFDNVPCLYTAAVCKGTTFWTSFFVRFSVKKAERRFFPEECTENRAAGAFFLYAAAVYKGASHRGNAV